MRVLGRDLAEDRRAAAEAAEAARRSAAVQLEAAARRADTAEATAAAHTDRLRELEARCAGGGGLGVWRPEVSFRISYGSSCGLWLALARHNGMYDLNRLPGWRCASQHLHQPRVTGGFCALVPDCCHSCSPLAPCPLLPVARVSESSRGLAEARARADAASGQLAALAAERDRLAAHVAASRPLLAAMDAAADRMAARLSLLEDAAAGQAGARAWRRLS